MQSDTNLSSQEKMPTKPLDVPETADGNTIAARSESYKMIKLVVAFDCDGTLVTTDSAEKKRIVANERIRTLLVTLASFKNIRIVVWSGGGEMWARQVGASLGLDKYVWRYATKNYLGKVDGKHQFDPDIVPDIAIDDIQDCQLGVFNLICREK